MSIPIALLLICASPIVDSPNMALYSKRLEEQPQVAPHLGLFISILHANNSIASTIAPLYAGWCLMDEYDHIYVFIGKFFTNNNYINLMLNLQRTDCCLDYKCFCNDIPISIIVYG